MQSGEVAALFQAHHIEGAPFQHTVRPHQTNAHGGFEHGCLGTPLAWRVVQGNHENVLSKVTPTLHLDPHVLVLELQHLGLFERLHDVVSAAWVAQNPCQRNDKSTEQKRLHIDACVFGDLGVEVLVAVLFQPDVQHCPTHLGIAVTHGRLAHVEAIGIHVCLRRGGCDFHAT